MDQFINYMHNFGLNKSNHTKNSGTMKSGQMEVTLQFYSSITRWNLYKSNKHILKNSARH